MNIYLPTLIYSEKDCVMKRGNILASTGRKAMIVTGKHSSKANGSLQAVVDAFEKAGKPYVIFDDIEENPSVETVMRARDIGVKEQVDFVVGVGGGSPLDACKAISLMIANPLVGAEVLYENVMLPYLPVVTVPTTAGTGSEVTPYAILTLHQNKTKKSISHKIYPVMALVDYTYLKTQSENVLINTVVDALAHLIESYLNTNANDLNRMYSEQGLRMFSQVKDSLRKPDDSVYKTLSNIAMIAGMAIAHTGTSLPHGLSYSVTYELGVPHGKAVGIYLGGYLKLYQNKEESKRVLDFMDFDDYDSFSAYLKELLGDVQIPEELVKRNAAQIFENKAKLKNYPYDVTKDQLEKLLG